MRLLTTMFLPTNLLPHSTLPACPHQSHSSGHNLASISHLSCRPSSPLQGTSTLVSSVFNPNTLRTPDCHRSLRCTATKAAKVKIMFCCSSCGHDTVQWWGRCPSCGEFGTCALVFLQLLPCFEKLAMPMKARSPNIMAKCDMRHLHNLLNGKMAK